MGPLLIPPLSRQSKSGNHQCHHQRGNGGGGGGSRLLTRLLLLVGSFLFLPFMVQADIVCTQFGSDTFRVNSRIKFFWRDTGSYPLHDVFKLNLYCYENSKLIKNLAELNTTASISPQHWVVDESILKTTTDCPLNQYQGGFEWIYLDPITNEWTAGTSKCKVVLLVGPGVTAGPGQPSPPPPSPSDLPPTDNFDDDEPSPREVVVTDRIKHILIGVGSAVGALVLAGVIGFYFIRYKNKRAEQDFMNKKLREPLQQPSTFSSGSAAQRRNSGHGHTTIPIPPKSEMVEGMPATPAPVLVSAPGRERGSTSSRPKSYMSGTRPGTPITTQYSSPLPRPSEPFVTDRPPSLLTSSFTPPDDYHQQQKQQQRQSR